MAKKEIIGKAGRMAEKFGRMFSGEEADDIEKEEVPGVSRAEANKKAEAQAREDVRKALTFETEDKEALMARGFDILKEEGEKRFRELVEPYKFDSIEISFETHDDSGDLKKTTWNHPGEFNATLIKGDLKIHIEYMLRTFRDAVYMQVVQAGIAEARETYQSDLSPFDNNSSHADCFKLVGEKFEPIGTYPVFSLSELPNFLNDIMVGE